MYIESLTQWNSGGRPLCPVSLAPSNLFLRLRSKPPCPDPHSQHKQSRAWWCILSPQSLSPTGDVQILLLGCMTCMRMLTSLWGIGSVTDWWIFNCQDVMPVCKKNSILGDATLLCSVDVHIYFYFYLRDESQSTRTVRSLHGHCFTATICLHVHPNDLNLYIQRVSWLHIKYHMDM